MGPLGPKTHKAALMFGIAVGASVSVLLALITVLMLWVK